MLITDQFEVDHPVERVWEFFDDIPGVARCLPGTELNEEIAPDHYGGGVIIGLLANGHVLLEGVPGLAKTLSIKSLAHCMNAQFARLQFTPDMLPADVVGTQIYNPQSGNFTTRQGANLRSNSRMFSTAEPRKL